MPHGPGINAVAVGLSYITIHRRRAAAARCDGLIIVVV
jgi:hypothetical protein